MQPVLDALNDQRQELDRILSGLDDGKWSTPTPRCPGWTVADVVLHLAQTDEAAVASEMAARTLASTRLSECWIHTGDIADALGVALAPTDRLWHIARLAWRTLPYAFARGDRTLLGPVALRLTAPDGTGWSFGEDADAATTVTGPALDFCLVAGQRLDASDSALVGSGPDAVAVLELVRTFA